MIDRLPLSPDARAHGCLAAKSLNDAGSRVTPHTANLTTLLSAGKGYLRRTPDNITAGPPGAPAGNVWGMAKREKKAGAGQVAARLRALIAAKGLSSSAELGELLDVGDTRARNWLNGTATMPVSFAIQLATLWKAPILEWVFAGVPDFLPHALVRAMEQGYVTGTEALASQPIDGSPKPSRKVSLFEQEVALIALWREISLERKEVVFRAAGGDPGILAS